MALLFVDTTYDIHLGLLSDELKWIDFHTHTGQKASAVLQTETQKLCAIHKLRPQELKGIITVSGPGFYTGLRLSEGFADIFKFFGIPVYSFYTYDIPQLCGFESGVWMTKAYRGEYFFHTWNREEKSEKLVLTKEVDAELVNLDHVFIHSSSAIDIELKNSTSTIDLLKQRPDSIFETIIANKSSKESFYFRAPEDEFRTANS